MSKRKFYPGDLVCKKLIEKYDPEIKGIIEYSYKDAFKCGSHSEYSVLWLDKNDKPLSSSAWYYGHSLKLLDDTHREDNIKTIIKYNKKCGDGAPIMMDYDFAKSQGYDYVHTYESAMATSLQSNDEICIKI